MAQLLRRALALATVAVLSAGLLTAVPADQAYAEVATSPALLAPTHDSDQVGNPEFSWGAVAGASTYRFELSTSSTFATAGKIYGTDTYGLHATPPNDLPGGPLYWRVASISGSAVGAYAEENFTKTAAAGPKAVSPGNQAMLAYPKDAPLLTWSVLTGVAGYEVELDDADDFVAAQTFKTANTALAISAPLTLGKPWHWRVRGISATTGITTAWSAAFSFTLTWGDDGAPRLLTPTPNETAVQDVNFSWTGTQDLNGVPGARAYRLQVSPNGDWANNITEDVVVKGTQYSPKANYTQTSYFWRVQAIATAPTASVQTGPWSSESKFDREWLDRPVLDPMSTALKHEVDKDDFRFTWTGVAHAAYYELRVGTDAFFNTATTTCTTLHTSLTPHEASALPAGTIGGDCTFEPLPGTKYFWQVKGVDSSTLSTKTQGVWSLTDEFIFDQDIVQQQFPLTNPTVTAPVLHWAPLSGYHTYAVTLVKAAVAPVPASGDTPATPGSSAQTTLGTTYSTSWSPVDIDARALGAGSYEWWVSAVSPGKVETPLPGTGGHFTVVASTSTATGFTSTSLSTDFGGQPQDMPSMSWTEIAGAAYYRVQYTTAGSNTFTELTRLADELPQAAYTYTGNPALPANHRETLPAGGWSWRVQAFTADDALIATSSPAQFVIAASPFVAGHTPVNGALKADVPELRWAPVVGTYEYRVFLALDVHFTSIVRTYSTSLTSLTPRESLPDNQAGQSYYWYVQVCASPGSCGAAPESASWTNPETIKNFHKQSPAPALISPASGGTAKIYDQASFAWEDYFTTDPLAPGAKSYKIEVATDSAFSKVIDTQVVDQAAYAPFAKTYPDSVYFWRVQALDGSGQPLTRSDNENGPWTFQKSSVRPIGLSSSVAGALPTLKWTPLSHAGSYTVEIFRGKDATFPIGNRQRSDLTSYPAFTPDKALPTGDYSWRVRKNDVDANPGTWAENAGVNTFTIAKPVVTLAYPGDAARLASSDTVFTWAPVVGASAYRFETSSSDSFASTFEVVKTVNPRWASPKYYGDGTTYRWRVSALDSTGTVIGTSKVFTFTKNEVSITLTSNTSPTKSHGVVTLTAAVTRPGKAVTGTVKFWAANNPISIGAGSIKANVATMVIDDLTVGSHTLTATWAGDSSSAAVTSADFVQNVSPAGAAYTPVTPLRVMERHISGGTTSTLTLSGVPKGATAVALNVTAADPTSNTYISVCPGGTNAADCKISSNINPYKGRTTPNMAIVKLGLNNTVTFYNNAGVTRVIADLQGWFVEGSPLGATYAPVTPTRAMAGSFVGAGKTYTLRVPNVPEGATAVALNVTAARPTSSTFVSVCPGGTAQSICKGSSALNPYLGSDTPNMVIVKLGSGGTVSFYNNAGVVKLIADVQGWFVDGIATSGSYVPVAPFRAMAFKSVRPAGTVTLDLDKNSDGTTATVPVPVGATAVVLNVTSTRQTINTYVSACPYGTVLATCKASSNLNPYTGRDIANIIVVKLGTGNQVTFYNNVGTTQLIADVQGWYVK